jgi:hypothetical protein
MPEISISAEAEKNIHPVSVLPSDQPLSQPSPGMALCLSGGGYRAMLFHLGTLWRLNELGRYCQLNFMKKQKAASQKDESTFVVCVN